MLRGGSRVGKGGVRIFTPDATGGYGAFWVRDWSYQIEGCPDVFSRAELRDGYLFLAGRAAPTAACPTAWRPTATASIHLAARRIRSDKRVGRSVAVHGDPLPPVLEAAQRLRAFSPHGRRVGKGHALCTAQSGRRPDPHHRCEIVPALQFPQHRSAGGRSAVRLGLFWDACAKAGGDVRGGRPTVATILLHFEADRVKARSPTCGTKSRGCLWRPAYDGRSRRSGARCLPSTQALPHPSRPAASPAIAWITKTSSRFAVRSATRSRYVPGKPELQ